MADFRIRQIIQSIFDRSSARKAEQDAKASAGRIASSFDRLKSAAIAAGAAIVAAFSLRAIVRGIKDFVRTSIEADAIWNRLAGTLANVGVQFSQQEGRIRAAARAMQDTTTIGDEQFAATLQQLVQLSGDYERSLEGVAIAADLAAALQIDMEQAGLLLGRAMAGNVIQFQRLNVQIDKNRDLFEQLREFTGPAAANELNTTAGRVKALANAWDDLKEAIGRVFRDMAGGGTILTSLTKKVKELEQAVERNRGGLVEFGKTARTVFGAVGRELAALFRLLTSSLRVVSNVILNIFTNVVTVIMGLVNTGIAGINQLIRAANLLPGPDIPLMQRVIFGGKTEEEWRAAINRSDALLKESIAEVGAAVLDVATAWAKVGEARQDAATPKQPVTGTRTPRQPTDPDTAVKQERDLIPLLRATLAQRSLSREEMGRLLAIERQLADQISRGIPNLADRLEIEQRHLEVVELRAAAERRAADEAARAGLREPPLPEVVGPAGPLRTRRDEKGRLVGPHDRPLAGRQAARGLPMGRDIPGIDKLLADIEEMRRAREAAAEAYLDFLDEAEARGMQFASVMTGAFTDFFTGIIEGSRGVGRILVAHLLEGFAEYLALKAKAAFAEALLTSNPKAAAAGVLFSAAAGLARALAGSMARATTGGGGRGLAVASGSVGATRAGFEGDRLPPTVTINLLGKGWPALDPDFQRSVTAAVQFGQERFGQQARITVNPPRSR